MGDGYHTHNRVAIVHGLDGTQLGIILRIAQLLQQLFTVDQGGPRRQRILDLCCWHWTRIGFHLRGECEHKNISQNCTHWCWFMNAWRYCNVSVGDTDCWCAGVLDLALASCPRVSFPWPHILSPGTIGSVSGHDRVLAIEDRGCLYFHVYLCSCKGVIHLDRTPVTIVFRLKIPKCFHLALQVRECSRRTALQCSAIK